MVIYNYGFRRKRGKSGKEEIMKCNCEKIVLKKNMAKHIKSMRHEHFRLKEKEWTNLEDFDIENPLYVLKPVQELIPD